MQKLNENTTLIKEEELHQLIEGIVRKSIKEDKELVTEGKLEKTLKAVAAGTMSVAAALAFLYSPTDEEMRDANPNNAEMNRTVRTFDNPNDSLHHGTPVHQITPMKNESLHLTPNQFQQVIKESVCRILQEQGYQIDEGMLNEATPWQKMKAFGTGLANLGKKKGGFKANYQNAKGNYDVRNAEDAIGKLNNQWLAQNEKFQNDYNNATNDKEREQIRKDWNNAYQAIKNNASTQYNKYMQDVDRSRELSRRANPNAKLNQDTFRGGLYRQGTLGYDPQQQTTGNAEETGWKPEDYDPRTEQRYEDGYKKGYEDGLNAGQQQTTGNAEETGWKPEDYDPRTEQRYEDGYKKGYEDGLNAGQQQTAKGFNNDGEGIYPLNDPYRYGQNGLGYSPYRQGQKRLGGQSPKGLGYKSNVSIGNPSTNRIEDADANEVE